MDQEIMQLMYDRDFAKSKADNLNDPEWSRKYLDLKRQIRLTEKCKKHTFLNENATLKYTNPRKFWKNMSRFMPKFNPKSIPRTMTPETFNTYFCNVAVNIDTLFRNW